MNVTLFEYRGGKPFICSVFSFLDYIKQGRWEDKVNPIRTAPNKETKDKLKNKLPFAIISGEFKGAKDIDLLKHNGLICIDIDNLDGDLKKVEENLSKDPYTMAMFRSVGGKGLAVLVKINPQKHYDSFMSLGSYYLNKYDVIIDESCKNVSRNRFISFDPNLYVNHDSKLFNEYLKKKAIPKNIQNFVYDNKDLEYIIQQINSKKIDLTANYYDWINIGFALSKETNGREYFHAISQNNPDYDYNKCDKKYDSILKDSRGRVNINTFFYYAKLHNLDLITSDSKVCTTVSKNHKKGKMSKEQAAQTLEEIKGISKERSKDIIDQVYDNNIDLDADNEVPLIEQVELFLKGYDIKRNIITRKMEWNGKEMEDKHYKQIWRECLHNCNDKVKRSFLEDVMTSELFLEYNPLLQFFEDNKHRNPKGLIKKLAECIPSDTGMNTGEFLPTYKETFITKWLVGMISAIHDEYSPLVLVLTGIKQGTGKTEFFRRLFPMILRKFFAESKLDRGKDDELLMCQKLLIVDDEFGGKSKTDEKKLKDLTSKQWFSLREPYGRTNIDLKRLAVLGGTSNDDQVLNDPTGNRRIIPINVIDTLDFDSYNSIDKTDLLMEAYHLYKDGFKWQLLKEDIELLANNTNEFKGAVLEEELINKYYSLCDNPNEGDFVSTTEIKVFLEKESQQKLSMKKIGTVLKSLGFVRIHKKIDGKTKAGFDVYIKNTA